jgi:hypothetical protein
MEVHMKAVVALAILSYVAGASVARAEEVTVLGCAQLGVEAGCIILKSKGKTYNITGAKPTPKLNSYGKVTGTVTSNPSSCNQGTALANATWKEMGNMCAMMKQ